jgi:threonyl-tRNA synthetase
MRLVFVHAGSCRFEASADARATGDSTLWQRSGEISESCLVVFATVESGDETDPGAVAANAATEITATATQLGVGQIVLFPSAHLSPIPAPSAVVPEIIAAVGEQTAAEADDTAVGCVPADDKTSIEIAAKGHPHARQSTRVWPYAGEDAHTGENEWLVVFPDGQTQSAETVEAGDRAVDQTMQTLLARVTATGRLELGRVAEGSEMSPAREAFCRDVIAEHVHSEATDAGAVPVGTGGPAGPGQRQRVRLASGLPVELPSVVSSVLATRSDADHAKRCYRLATAPQLREAVAAETLPSMTTPELWALAGDTDRALAECEYQVGLVGRLGEALGLSSTPLVRVRRWEQHREWIDRLVTGLDEPVLVERGGRPSDPWDIELARVSLVDSRPVRLGSVGVAFGGLSAFDASGTASSGVAGESGPLVCAALLCSVERAVSATVDHARERDPPRLPVWLAPEQVRLVPTEPGTYTDTCEALADEIEATAAGIRVGIDARERSVGERLDAAASALVPYVAVVGRPEAEGGPLSVIDRAARTERDLTPAALRERLLADLDGWPTKSRYQPRRVT